MSAAHVGHRWAVVLAGGEGRQLHSLTTLGCGTPVPKQFCSLSGGRTLLEDAVTRAEDVVGAGRVFTVVTHHQQQWWSRLLADQPSMRILDQPCARGTGVALLYAALRIELVDPLGQLIILPADHHIRDEAALRRGLRHALDHLRRDLQQVVLLGIMPDEVDADLSYILPRGRSGARLLPISELVDGVDSSSAADLIRNGGLWNTFTMTASVPGLIGLFQRSHPALVRELRLLVVQMAQMAQMDDDDGWRLLCARYEALPRLDFCRDVLQGQPRLKVLRMANCGWSDLGTPRRLVQTLNHLQHEREASQSTPFLSLAAHVTAQGSSVGHWPGNRPA